MEYLVEPWDHQKKAMERARELSSFALFFEMGTGKTGTAINILRERFNERRAVSRTLIFCPPIVIKNWGDEWKKHSRIAPRAVVLLQGSGKQRLKTFREQSLKEGRVFVTNYETLSMPDVYAHFQAWGPEAIIFDESHYLKSAESKRSKLAEALANPQDKKTRKPLQAPFKLILTGTPVLNSALDLFQQYLILDGGRTFGANFFVYRARYFRDRNAGMPKERYFPDWVVRPGALEEINQLISQTGMRVEKKDCLDLPPLVQQTLKVPLDRQAKIQYEEMKRDFITYMNDKAVVATMAMTKALRLMQIASGFVKTVDGEEIPLGLTPKMIALKDLLAELTPNHKVLVWAVWKNNYAQIRSICEELGIAHVEVHGDITPTQKIANVACFETDPKCRVFIGHPGSGGLGINLVSASYSIFYSRTFSLGHSLQAEARNHRGGSKEAGHEKITRIDLVSSDTIDELVLERLVNKQEISDRVLKDLAVELKNSVAVDSAQD